MPHLVLGVVEKERVKVAVAHVPQHGPHQAALHDVPLGGTHHPGEGRDGHAHVGGDAVAAGAEGDVGPVGAEVERQLVQFS